MFPIFWYQDGLRSTSHLFSSRSKQNQVIFGLFRKRTLFAQISTSHIDRSRCIWKKQCLVIIAGRGRSLHPTAFGIFLKREMKWCQKKSSLQIFFNFFEFLGSFPSGNWFLSTGLYGQSLSLIISQSLRMN